MPLDRLAANALTTQKFPPTEQCPARGCFAITPADGSDLSAVTRAISVNVSGNVAVEFWDSSTATLYLTAGILHPLSLAKVKSTGTDAAITSIIGYV